MMFRSGISWIPSLAITLLVFALGVNAEETPFTLSPKWDYPALGAGVVAAGLGYYSEWRIARNTFDPSAFDPSRIPAYDHWAVGYYSPLLAGVSDALIVAEGLAPVALAGSAWSQGRESFGELWTEAVLYGEVVAYSSAFSLASKSLRVHPRPLAFTENASASERTNGDARSSFVSEHATGAFAAGVFAAYTFQTKYPESPWVPWIWSGALGTAATTAALRVFSGKHFPSDVVAGSALGSLIGFTIPWLHENAERAPGNKTGCVSARPISLAGLGLSPTANGLVPVVAFHFLD